MKSNKKIQNIILALVMIVSLLVLFFTVAPAFMLATVNNPTTNYAKYDDYKNEFSVIVEWLTEKYDGKPEVNLAVEVNRETHTSYLYDFGAKSKVEMPENVLEALSKVDRKAFNSKSDLASIKISGKRICFCTFNGEYALVYSQNGRPWRVLGQNVFSKSLGQGWYHCTFTR